MIERIAVNECDKDIERLFLDTIAERIGSDRFGLWFGSETRLRCESLPHLPKSVHSPCFAHSADATGLAESLSESTDPLQLAPVRLQLVVPNRFLADWIRKNFRDLIHEAAFAVLKRPCVVSISVDNALSLPAGLKGENRGLSAPMVSAPALAEPLFVPAAKESVKATPKEKEKGSGAVPAPLGLAFLGNTAKNVSTAKAAIASIAPVGVIVRNGTEHSRPTPFSIASAPVKTGTKNGSGGTKKHATLAEFVVAPSNELARKAADFAIEHTGTINPIYIFGPTSTGKTHLLEAIRGAIAKKSGRKPALLLSAEQFTNTFINSLRQGGMPTFRNKFRDISVLLIDDLPFLIGKKQTQIELIQQIDMLKSQGVQIVLTGDRPIGQLTELRGEILSRLEAGMVCEIKPAESGTLLKIFRNMCVARGISVPEDVCRFVAANLNVHARQLSGALNRLHAVQLGGVEAITLETARVALEDLLRNNHRSVKIQDIEKAVCETFGLHPQSLQSKSRTKSVTQPRMLAMWLARKYTRSALTEIGKFFGDRSHSTVITAQKKVEQWIGDDASITCGSTDCQVAEAIRIIERHLASP